MKRLFRIDFYPNDWLVKTQGLTPEQCGFYIQIISLIYATRGSVVNDPIRISRLLRSSVRTTKRVINELLNADKLQLIGGSITNERAMNELSIKNEHLMNSESGGNQSAKRRAELNKNKDLISSGGVFSPSTPSPTATATASKDKEEKFDPIKMILPDWLSKESWVDFVEHRKSIKNPLKERAAKLTISELEKFKKKGHDPSDIINKSIMNNWKGVFEPKENLSGSNQQKKQSYSEGLQKAAEGAIKNVERVSNDEIY